MSKLSLTQHLQSLSSQAINSSRGGARIFSAPGGAGLLFAALLAKETPKDLLLIAPTYEEGLEAYEDLRFYFPPCRIGFFPHQDCLPYDNQSPSKGVTALRLKTLMALRQGEVKILVTTAQALLQRLLPPEPLQEFAFDLQVGEEIDPEDLAHRLIQLGYNRVEMVEEKGEFSRRGGIFDLFPLDLDEPVRLDFFDIEIESLRHFSVETQGSGASLERVKLFPASEVILADPYARRGSQGLNETRERAEKNRFFQIREALEAGQLFSGIEAFLPLFYETTRGLEEYFLTPPLLLFLDQETTQNQAKQAFEQVLQEYQYALEQGEPSLEPQRLYRSDTEMFSQLFGLQRIDLTPLHEEGPSGLDLQASGTGEIAAYALQPDQAMKSSAQRVLERLIQWQKEGAKVWIAAGSESRADHLRQFLESYQISPTLQSSVSPEERLAWMLLPSSPSSPGLILDTQGLNQGYRFVGAEGQCSLAVVTEEDIFGPKEKKRRVKESSLKYFMSSLGDLKEGDFVVHVEYGVGAYEGLKKISTGNGGEADFLVLNYQGSDKVYVPVEKFHLVQKYKGAEGQRPRLAKLGDRAWVKTKAKIQAEVDELAQELVVLYAKRAARRGHAFAPDGELGQEFALAFPFAETPDQTKVIEEVKTDMESEQPMDRLVCGDVGFGKTEIALRAAFKAVVGGMQVGILAPTTILAQQHFDTFKERMRDQAVKVALISRFVSPKQINETLQDLKQGKVDILVGTHRLLSKDVEFKNLGLLVVDEEQRFGVKHKERIKQMRTSIDCLTLSATPIPRTLHMALMGIRDISIINTAPLDRRAVRTRLMKLNEFVIKEAVSRELRRGGQIFFIHNRVESIHEVGNFLKSILPKVRIAIGHGQMHEHELEKIMFDFIHKKTDLLLATTIVESGLDIPNANTILINNADQLGLSQLYQLRGRVGRAKEQAYCYLLTPKEKLLSEVAKKRLNILSELNHLGAGFKLASYDLELRGAGDLLGSKQSGHINQLGFELYTQMIEEAVGKLTGDEPLETAPQAEFKLHLEQQGSLPEPFIPSMNQRLEAYKAIAAAKNQAGLWEVRSNLEDRYGPLPLEALNLFYVMQIRLLAKEMGLIQLAQQKTELTLYFSEAFNPDPALLMPWLQGQRGARLLPQGGLKFQLKEPAPKAIAQRLLDFFSQVIAPANP